MNIFKKIISYIYPINVKKVVSERSGVIEITYVNGKLVMDSKHANYSYGDLQKVLQKGLRHIGKEKLQKCESILILGVAGGSVIQTLIKEFEITAAITGVEIDETTLKLANSYFKLSDVGQLNLINADAFQFINTSKSTFDLIIVDIFNDDQMPNELFLDMFWNDTYKLLSNNGLCLFNSIVTSEENMERNSTLISSLKQNFSDTQVIKTHINELFIIQK